MNIHVYYIVPEIILLSKSQEILLVTQCEPTLLSVNQLYTLNEVEITLWINVNCPVCIIHSKESVGEDNSTMGRE